VTPLGDVFFIQESRNWVVSHSLPISQNLVNQFHFGYVNATANQNGATAVKTDIDALNLTGVFTNTLSDEQRGYPGIAFSAGGVSGAGGAVNDSTTSVQPMWNISTTTTCIRVSHTLNFGANYRRWQLKRDLAADFLGDFTFSGSFTGHPIADFLLGFYTDASVFQPSSFSRPDAAGNPRTYNFQYIAPYIQDDWKVNSRLTLNLGLRWDFRAAPYETNDHFGWLNPIAPGGGMFVADKTLREKGVIGPNSFYT